MEIATPSEVRITWGFLGYELFNLSLGLSMNVHLSNLFSTKNNFNNILLLSCLEITSFYHSLCLSVPVTPMQYLLTPHLLSLAFFPPPTQIKAKPWEMIESCSTSYSLSMSC